MRDSLPAIVAGVLLVAFGVGLAIFQWRCRHPQDLDDEVERLHATRQLRRRLQVSAMLMLVGILIPLSDLLPVFRRSPTAFTLMVLAILGLTVWIMLLALGDFASASSYHAQAQRRIHEERRALERQIEEFRAGGNGQRH